METGAPAVATPTPEGGGRGARARKAPETFKVDVKEKTEFCVLPGKGVKLGDMPNVCEMLTKYTSTHKVLQDTYAAAFGRRGAALNVKKHLREFSGFPPESRDVDVEKRTESLKKKQVADLKGIALVLCIERSGTKDELVKRIVDFLDVPSGSGRKAPAPAGTKRKRAASPKKKAAKSKGAKAKKQAASPKTKAKADPAAGIPKPPTAIDIYIKARLPALKEKNPEVSEKDLTQHLRDKWKGMAGDKKSKYEDEHKELLAKYEKEVAAAKTKAAKPDIQDSDDSDRDGDGDDDDDDDGDEADPGDGDAEVAGGDDDTKEGEADADDDA